MHSHPDYFHCQISGSMLFSETHGAMLIFILSWFIEFSPSISNDDLALDPGKLWLPVSSLLEMSKEYHDLHRR